MVSGIETKNKDCFLIFFQLLPISLHRIRPSDWGLPLQRLVHIPGVRRAGPVRLHRGLQRPDHRLQSGRKRRQVCQLSQGSQRQYSDTHVGWRQGLAFLGWETICHLSRKILKIAKINNVSRFLIFREFWLRRIYLGHWGEKGHCLWAARPQKQGHCRQALRSQQEASFGGRGHEPRHVGSSDQADRGKRQKIRTT